MFAALSKFVYRRRWSVLAAGLVFMILSGVFGTTVFGNLKSGGFNDPAVDSSKVLEAMHDKLGRDDTSLIVLFNAKDGSAVDSPAFKQGVEATLAKLQGRSEIGTITTFYNSGATPLVSNDKKSTYAVVGLNGDDTAITKYMKELRPLLTENSPAPNLQVRLGGNPAANQEINTQVSEDIEKAEILTFPILTVLLILIFGSLIAAALPLAIGGVAILGAFLILRVLTNFTDISIFASSVVSILGLGLAIDYSLFIVSRFREELKRFNGNVQSALTKTMQTAGRTVLFSGLTVSISLLSLLVFPQMFLRSMGLGGTAAVVVAMVASLTILPAALALLGERVNSLNVMNLIRRNRSQTVVSTEEKHGFWYNLSAVVMRRPVIVLVVVLIPLIIVGLPFFHVNMSIPDARALPEGKESRTVSEILTDQFPRNETSPIELVIRTDGNALDSKNISALYDYTRQVAAVSGVRRVDSLVTINPQLDKNAYQGFYSEAGRAQNPQAAQVAAQFAKDNYTLVSVLYDSDPLSNTTQDIVRNIRSLAPPAGMSVQVGGFAAQLIDFLGSLGRSVPIAFAIIVAVIFILLFLMLGSLVIPLKAVILNIVSLSVSFGALVWIFQDGNLSDFFHFTSLGSIDGTQPVLIFAIAFGLSMDYEVFLLSRIKEQYDRTGNTTSAVALGIQKTGSIITSAALLLFIVIGAFATAEVVFIKQIGVGLGLAVLVDATIVRMFLVPATMRLMGRFNWWAPTPLKALYNRWGLSESEPEDSEPVEATPIPALSGNVDRA